MFIETRGRENLPKVSPESVGEQELQVLQKEARDNGHVLAILKDGLYIQTQELNPKHIGPFESERAAHDFLGVEKAAGVRTQPKLE